MAVKEGYQTVYVFRGGLPEWIKAGYPVETIEKLPKVDVVAITPQQLKDLLDSNEEFILLDIRLASDAARYWIETPRRQFVSLNRLPMDYEQVPRGKKLVILDKIGKRSGIAARFLTAKGYEDISAVSGGINQWIKLGLPTEIKK